LSGWRAELKSFVVPYTSIYAPSFGALIVGHIKKKNKKEEGRDGCYNQHE